ncbi:aspartate carbamoyltransferase [Patescibacteria group bacterium]|nr:aspartate carbamoyltransferase [Patescibacteria group bacterium]
MENKKWSEDSQEIRKRALIMNWQEFSVMGEKDKTVFLNNIETDNPFHVLFSQQFDRRSLDLLCQVAEKARMIHKDRVEGRKFLKSLLFGTYALNFFHQPSTRTFLSFQTAQEVLGMGIRDIRDPSTSSEAKGETLEDSIRTFSSYFDLIIMRHENEQAAELGAWVLNKSDRRIPIINAGSGKDQHPTQALTDVYTLYKSFDGKIDGRTIVMVGDLARGRTVRSLSYLMKNYRGMKLIFVSPLHLRVSDDIRSFFDRHQISYREADNLREVIPVADAIYMTRVQDEWDQKDQGEPIPGQVKIHQPINPKYKFKKEYLDLMKENAVLMHPLPKRDEIDEEVGYSSDKRVVFWRQERNGMWMRVALIATIFQKENEILNWQ